METIQVTKSITVRPVLVEEKRNNTGGAPIKICITVHGRRGYKTTGHRIEPKYWDKEELKLEKDCPNVISIRRDVTRRMEEYAKKINRLIDGGETVTIDAVMKILRPEQITNPRFYHYATDLIQDLRNDFSCETMEIYDNEMKRLFGYENKKGVFVKGYTNKNLTFVEMDTIWLRKYKSWLQGPNFKTKSKYLANNTIHKSFKFLKKIFSKAIKDKVFNYYPFEDYSESPKYIQTDRIWLTESEVNRIENVLLMPIPDYMERTIYYFLLGCYSGLRYCDWARFNHDNFVTKGMNGDRLITRCKKNGETVSMQVHSKLARVLEWLKTAPPVDCETVVNRYLKGIAKLAGIDKELSTHKSRHSFAVRCAELGISIETTAELMGITVKTCQIYYRVTNRKIDNEFSVWDKQPEKELEKMAAV